MEKKIVNWAQILPFYHLQATGYFSVNPIYSLLVIIYLLFTRKVFSNFNKERQGQKQRLYIVFLKPTQSILRLKTEEYLKKSSYIIISKSTCQTAITSMGF